MFHHHTYSAADQYGFVEPVDGLGESVVVAVTDTIVETADSLRDLGLMS